jgi:hypothetical protein
VLLLRTSASVKNQRDTGSIDGLRQVQIKKAFFSPESASLVGFSVSEMKLLLFEKQLYCLNELNYVNLHSTLFITTQLVSLRKVQLGLKQPWVRPKGLRQ